jgi:hypothetical protein
VKCVVDNHKFAELLLLLYFIIIIITTAVVTKTVGASLRAPCVQYAVHVLN